MALRMIARRSFARSVAPGVDSVLFGISLPSGTRLNQIIVRAAFNGSVRQSVLDATAVAFEMWILPVTDPDAGTNLDTLWDRFVPKDSDVETLDLDTGAADTTPFWEPGEIDWGHMFNIGLRPRRLVHDHRWLSAADGAITVLQDNQSAFLTEFLPGGQIRIRIRRGMMVDAPSVLVFAVGSPNLDDVTTTVQNALQEAEWSQVKYMEHVLERALLDVLGVQEAGAETPWDEASKLLQTHLDPDVFVTSGALVAGTFFTFGEAIIDHTVVGSLEKIVVTSGR